MRDIDSKVQALEPDALKARLSELSKTYADHDGLGLDGKGIEELFEWMLGSAHAGEQGRPVELYHLLDTAIHDFQERHPEAEEGFDYRFEWSIAALRFVPEQRDRFVCLPIYQELFEVLEAAPPTRRHLAVRARMHVMKHLQYWQNQGGKNGKFSSEDAEWLDEMEHGYEEASDNALGEAEQRGDVEVVVQLYRDAAQFYFFTKQPNDGIACLKSALEEMPKVPGYIPADSAHVLMEIGQVFLSFKKPAIALKYFTQAKDIYDEGGEDLEMEAYRAEGWIDACKKAGA
jgi:tetratricopeptide (TPR) repeat protein